MEQTEIERRILIQSFILFLALIAASFFDTIWILFGVTTSEDVKNNALYANNILDSLLYGINPVMNITLNRFFFVNIFCKIGAYY